MRKRQSQEYRFTPVIKLRFRRYVLLSFFFFCHLNWLYSQDRIYAKERQWAYPQMKDRLHSNPPAFQWPAVNGKAVTYEFRLSKDSLFKNSFIKEQTPWAVFTPHHRLGTGIWYWKYSLECNVKDTIWSPVYSFRIDETMGNSETPLFSELEKNLKSSHPRLWVDTQPEIEQFRSRNKNNPEAGLLMERARKYIKEELPEIKPVRVKDTSGMSPLNKKLTIEYMYHGFGDKISDPLKDICYAYQLTGDKAFAEAGVRRLIQMAQLDPTATATRDDFNSGKIMETMALAYDWFYDFLNPEQRTLVKEAILTRGRRFYRSMKNNFEAALCDNHVWQHIFREFVAASYSLYDVSEEAREWLHYSYEVFSTRFPILNTADGGWFEGNGYFQVHFETLIYLPYLLRQITGINYYQKYDWFKNLPYYLIYTFPPESASTAMGDQHERLQTPSRNWIAFSDALSREVPDPDFDTYVSQLLKSNTTALKTDRKYLLYRLLSYNPRGKLNRNSPYNLSRSRLFEDIGLGVYHADLEHPHQDLMVSFSSSPFGVLGHAHASQNSFTINYRGETIFGGSGYYSNFSDAHNLLDYRTSFAYNTVVPDSLGQSFGGYGYGKIIDFKSGRNWSYFLGDAGNAYTGRISPFWLDRFERRDIAVSRENGIGNAGVKKYLRHLMTLDSNIVIIYDELEAEDPVKWTWQIHGFRNMKLTSGDQDGWNIQVPLKEESEADVMIYAGNPTKGILSDRFRSPAINWKGKEVDGKVVEYPNQFHVGITSESLKKERFLGIILIGKSTDTEMIRTQRVSENEFRVGKYLIHAELNALKAPAFVVSEKGKEIVRISK